MVEPAERPHVEPPPTDPAAIARRYRFQRAKRRALQQRERERRRANVRFWIVVLVLLGGCAYLSLTIWHQIQHLFGL
jgi:hypothetical protein